VTLPRLLYPAEEVANALGVSAYWLREQARTGQVRAQKVAGTWKFTRAQVDWLVGQLETAGNSTAPRPASGPRRSRATATVRAETAPVRLISKPPRRSRSR